MKAYKQTIILLALLVPFFTSNASTNEDIHNTKNLVEPLDVKVSDLSLCFYNESTKEFTEWDEEKTFLQKFCTVWGKVKLDSFKDSDKKILYVTIKRPDGENPVGVFSRDTLTLSADKEWYDLSLNTFATRDYTGKYVYEVRNDDGQLLISKTFEVIRRSTYLKVLDKNGKDLKHDCIRFPRRGGHVELIIKTDGEWDYQGMREYYYFTLFRDGNRLVISCNPRERYDSYGHWVTLTINSGGLSKKIDFYLAY